MKGKQKLRGIAFLPAALALTILVALSFSGCFVTDFFFEGSGTTAATGDVTTVPQADTEQGNTVNTGTDESTVPEQTTGIDIIPYTTEPATTSSEPVATFPDPLTGLSYETDYSLIRPAAIVIDNLSVAAPQNGLARADIMIECLAEGGITRLILITNKYSSNEVYGPIRSTRDYMVSLSQAFGALMVGGGFSPSAGQLITDNAFNYIDGVHDKYALSGFFRDISRYNSTGYEHSLMITGQGIKALAGINNFAVTGSFSESPFRFASEATLPVKDAVESEHIVLNYSEFQKVQLVYSRSQGVYYRYQFGTRPHIDADTGEQINFANLLVLFSDHVKIAGDDAGRLNVGTVGTGTGWFATGGAASPIVWERETLTSPIKITYADGTEAVLSPGKTMISLFPAEYKDTTTRFNINLVSN